MPIIRHASSSAHVFRVELMYDMVRVGSLLFGSQSKLVFREQDFWALLEREHLGTDSRQIFLQQNA